jgi:signal transduction histidine kinase
MRVLNPFRLTGLRLRLFILLVVAAVPALALVLVGGLRERERAAEEAQQDALQLAMLTAARHDELIQTARITAETLSLLPQVIEGVQPECNELLASVNDTHVYYSGIFVVNPAGDVICSAPPATDPVSAADRDYFQEALTRREFFMGPFTMGRITGRAALPAVYPVLDDAGNVAAVMVVGFDLAWLERYNRGLGGGEDRSLVVFNEDGVILSYYPDGVAQIGEESDAPIIQHVLASPGAGTAQAEGANGVTRLYGYAPLSQRPENSAYVAVGIPASTAFAEANRALLRNLSAWMLVLAGLSLAWLLSEVLIAQRVDQLLHTAEYLAAGDLSARVNVERPRGELDHLAVTLDKMAASLEQQIEERRQAEEHMRELALQLATAQEEERRQLALELHDNAGQVLTALLIQLELLESHLPGEMSEEKERLQELIGLTDTLAEELRGIAHNLRPPVLDRLGLVPALRVLCEDFARHTQIPIQANIADLPAVPDAIGVACFRFLQEGLNNVARHAGADDVKVMLAVHDGHFTLELSDNGAGFSPDGTNGLGLLSMRERIESIGGAFEVNSAPEAGTCLRARVPL